MGLCGSTLTGRSQGIGRDRDASLGWAEGQRFVALRPFGSDESGTYALRHTFSRGCGTCTGLRRGNAVQHDPYAGRTTGQPTLDATPRNGRTAGEPEASSGVVRDADGTFGG